MDSLKLIFVFSMAMFGAHLILTIFLRILTRKDLELDAALFAVPNKAINPHAFTRLLRLKYSIPWSSPPPGMSEQSFSVRAAFLAARASGAAFFCAILVFFALAVYLGGH